MSETVDIGAARVRLIVDSVDFEQVIAQGKNAVQGFGTAAQNAYDRTEKATRRSADALLDYVNSIGRADSALDKYIRNASRLGNEDALIDAAVASWVEKTSAIDAAKAAQAGYADLVSTAAAAEIRANKEASAAAAERAGNLASARAATAQQSINSLVAPGLTIDPETQAHRLAAEEVFAEIQQRELALIEAQTEALQRQAALVETIAQARGQQNAANAQQDFNRLLGIPQEEEKLALIQRRADATAAFLPALQEEIKLEQESAALAEKQQAFAQQLENIANTAGKTYYQMLQLKAAELGVSEAAAPMIQKIKQQNEATGAGTLSAKQYAFALRGLPAQFTDIVVSLQGGQRPLTVLLQQGGQIKDMFGGVGNAVKTVSREVLKLATNPWVLLAGAIAAVGFAAFEAQSRVEALALATAKGNQVAGSATGLSTLAEQLAKLKNISIGNADAAVESLAAAGKLSGENFERAAQASARWATITGQSVDDVTAKFNEIVSDPMAAVLAGTLRITAAQYAQLEALDRVGAKTQEAALAVKLYQDQVNSNSDSVLKNLTDGEQGWISLRLAISDTTHEFGAFIAKISGEGFVGLKKFTSDFVDVLHPKTGSVGTSLFNAFVGNTAPEPATFDPSQMTVGGKTVAAATAAATGAAPVAVEPVLTPTQVAAQKATQNYLDTVRGKTELYNTEVRKLDATLSELSATQLASSKITKDAAGKFSGAAYAQILAGIKLKVFGQNAGGDPTLPIKEWEKTALDALKNVQQAQDYLYADGTTTIDTYYAISRGLAKSDEIIQLESIDKQEAALKNVVNSESKRAALAQQRYTVEETYANKKAALDRAELLAVTAKINAYHDYVQSLADANNQLGRQGDQAAAGVGTGSRQAALANAKSNAIYNEQLAERAAQDKVDALPAGSDHDSAQAEADKQKTAAAAALSTQLTLLQGNDDSLATAEHSYLNGSVKAWQDWQTQVSNQAVEAGKVFDTVMNGIASSIADAAVKGKLSFKSLITDLLQELVEFGAKQAETMALKAVIGGTGGTSGTASGITGLISLFSAKGNAFSAGPGLAAYRNSVVSSPTMFPFARGGVPNVGLMGEKSGSPGEAIMPLTRTSGGELAVKTTGQTGRTIVTNQTFVVPGAVNRQTQSQIAIKTFGAAQRAARRA